MTDTVMSTDLPVNDPTNPAHRLADDLRNGRIPGYAADDVRAVLTMLAASPQGEGEWITHDGGPNPVPTEAANRLMAYVEARRIKFKRDDMKAVAEFVLSYRVTEGVKP